MLKVIHDRCGLNSESISSLAFMSTTLSEFAAPDFGVLPDELVIQILAYATWVPYHIDDSDLVPLPLHRSMDRG